MKLTAEGIAVIEGDTYLSAEIIKAGRLDVARDTLLKFREHIPEGGIVCDVGACLGDFTATFSEFVGPTGVVHAFEPNPPVVDCLLYNMREYRNVRIYQMGVGSEFAAVAAMIEDTNNIGASRLEPGHGNVRITTLDHESEYWTRLDFLKIDAEGWEPRVLDGAAYMIRMLRPVIMIEISTWPLGKLGYTAEDVFSRLDLHGYEFQRFDGPWGDVLCLPKEIA